LCSHNIRIFKGYILKSLILKDGYSVKQLKHKIDGSDDFDDFDFFD